MLLDPRRRRPIAVAPDVAARQFCVAVVLWACAAWTIVAALNFIVNPYAQYPTRLFPPRVQTSRAEKLHLLQQQPLPEGLVLGSSRVMKLEPDYLQAASGCSFFNAGVDYAKPEDYLAWLRYYQQLAGHAPRIVVLGLDVPAFAATQPVDARLLGLPPLARQVPEALRLRDRWRRWQELLSWQQSCASLQSLYRFVTEPAADSPSESFRRDGLLVYHRREQQLQAGTYDFGGALQANQREYRRLYAGFDHLAPWRCELLETLVRACHAQGTRVVLFTTPLHPELADSLHASSTHAARQRELIDFVQTLAAGYGCEFHDLSQIGSFGGDPRDFLDGVHPLEINTRRMIDRLIGTSPRERRDAVQ